MTPEQTETPSCRPRGAQGATGRRGGAQPVLDLLAAIRAKGLEPAFGRLDRLGSGDPRQVYSVSPKGWKRPILYDDGQQVLVVKGRR